jgi:hypothetical protein
MSEISWSTNFTAINCFKDFIEPCSYTISIGFNDESINEEDPFIAFGRVRSFLKDMYQDAIFVNLENQLLPTLHKKFKSRIITLPYHPNNFIIGVVTWYKLLSITQGRITLEYISVSCDKSDDLALNIDEDIISSDELMDDLAMKNWEKPAWWFRPTPTTWDIPIKKKNNEFVVETDENEWPEILQWDQKPVKMSKKKSENNIIPLKKGWKPEVIKGDKS